MYPYSQRNATIINVEVRQLFIKFNTTPFVLIVYPMLRIITYTRTDCSSIFGIMQQNDVSAKGSCQVKKNPKIREKLGLFRQHPHTILYNFLFFFETFLNMKTTHKNTKNTKYSKKIKNPSWGLIHPPTSEFFSDFWNFFNLAKPLSIDNGDANAKYVYTNRCDIEDLHVCFHIFFLEKTRMSETHLSIIILYSLSTVVASSEWYQKGCISMVMLC